MSTLLKIASLLAMTGVLCFANITITESDPNFGLATDSIYPDSSYALTYAIQNFTLTGPSGGGAGTWTLTVNTNYGLDPAGKTTMAPFCTNGATFVAPPSTTPCPGGLAFFMGDFLIEQGGTNYGIVMSTGHDDYPTLGQANSGYVAGNVYTASTTLGPAPGGNPNDIVTDQNGTIDPTILSNTGRASVASGTMTITANSGCYGEVHGSSDCALYKITDTFTVAPGTSFLNTALPFSIYVSSADCFNATLIDNYVPEPSGLVWMIPVMLLVGAYLRRRKLAEVK